MVSPGRRSPGGRSFHSRGPAAEKLLSPSLLCVRGTSSFRVSLELERTGRRPRCPRWCFFCGRTGGAGADVGGGGKCPVTCWKDSSIKRLNGAGTIGLLCCHCVPAAADLRKLITGNRRSFSTATVVCSASVTAQHSAAAIDNSLLIDWLSQRFRPTSHSTNNRS